MNYESPIGYDPARIRAAAVYCSDGRVGEHFDDFLQKGLLLPKYDRVALPGGPACLAGHIEAHVHQQGVIDEIKFLVETHGVTRMVLIAHAGCAFYSQRLRLPEAYLESQQKIDLVKAAQQIHDITGQWWVEAYYAHQRGSKVSFEPVPVR